ncbi:MAG: MotA/TolQ/ExbB proton channel family protein [Planctomycetota bacterium]
MKDAPVSRIASFCDSLLKSPLIWGVLTWLMFDLAVRRIGGEWLNSYLTASPVHRITTAVFFVGMASLAIRGLGLLGQFGVFQRELLEPIPAGGQRVEDASRLLERLEEEPAWLAKTTIVKRLCDALEYVRRRQSADDIETHLRTLEDTDYSRMSSGYAMVRVVTGVVPILGFLGTVIGITIAIAQLSPDQLESSLSEVTAGLSVAFDTTALALALSIILVFGKLLVERTEERLLVMTGQRAGQELIGRFEQYGAATDPNVASISRMCDQVVRAVEVMAAQQADLWRSTMEETNDKLQQATASAGRQLNEAVSSGLRRSLEGHAKGLTDGVEQQLAQLNVGLSWQSETLSEAVKTQVEALTAATGEQIAAIREGVSGQAQATADAVQAQVAVLTEVVERSSKRLDSGADELLGNLRAGLERMAELLVEALQKHGETLTAAEQELASENRRHLGEVEAALGEAMVVAADRQEKLIGRSEQLLTGMQTAVSESASATIAHQKQLVKQGEVLLKVVETTGQVEALETALNRNLDALGRGQNLEETLLSLSASIQLLSARAGRTGPDGKAAA